MTSEENVPTAAGLSSFNLLDEKKFVDALDLHKGMQLLDFGCGVGNYTITISPIVGDEGHIYAVDPWEEGIETLEVRAAIAGYTNIDAFVLGAGEKLPVESQVVDMSLMATVVHILVQEGVIEATLREITRVLRPGGRIAAVEFFKTEGPPGPPIEWRLSQEELKEVMAKNGFLPLKTTKAGPHNYLSIFTCRL